MDELNLVQRLTSDGLAHTCEECIYLQTMKSAQATAVLTVEVKLIAPAVSFHYSMQCLFAVASLRCHNAVKILKSFQPAPL